MKTNSRCQAGTLVMALLAITIVAAALGTAFRSTTATGRLGDRSRDYVETRLAVEGAVEYAFGIWKQRVQDQDRAISTTEANASLSAPVFPGFGYTSSASYGPLKVQATNVYGAPMTSASATPAPLFVSLADYPGWRGKSYNYVATARLSQNNPRGAALTAGVKRNFQYVEVPLFQAMFFYEHDLEMYRPAPMIVSGLVHTNSNLYLSTGVSDSLTFEGYVSHVDNFYSGNSGASNSTDNTAPPYATSWSGYGGTMYPPEYPNGAAAQVHEVDRYEPLGKDASTLINTGNTNPNDDSFRELIEPPSTTNDPATGVPFTDPGEISKRRLYNQAGIVVTINGTAATVTAKTGLP